MRLHAQSHERGLLSLSLSWLRRCRSCQLEGSHGEVEPSSQAFRGTAAKPLGSRLAQRPRPARSPWHGQLSRQPAAFGSPCSPVSQGSESLWSQLRAGHVLALVSGCSISSKSRCSDGAATHTGQARLPLSPLRPADCACVGYRLPVSLASLFVARSLPSEFSKSFSPSGSGPARCQRLSVIARARWRLPTGSLPSAQAPCWPVAAALPGRAPHPPRTPGPTPDSAACCLPGRGVGLETLFPAQLAARPTFTGAFGSCAFLRASGGMQDLRLLRCLLIMTLVEKVPRVNPQ